MNHTILPCPFCGSSEIEIRSQRNCTVHMDGSGGELICVYVYHHCRKGNDPYNSLFVQIRGRDEHQAVKLWNQRTEI